MQSDLNLAGIGMTSKRTRDRLVARLAEMGIQNPEVLRLIGEIPRHIFVDEALAHRAYEDTALPLGLGQTISQPYVVALMTELLFNTKRARILEVGTGCGYQTTLLADLCEKVWTIERIPELAERARAAFRTLKVRNVSQRVGDGFEGWAANGPYDGIIVTAAPVEIPEALLDQLAPGGRVVIPVGGDHGQALTVVDKTPEGYEISQGEAVRFVPLVKGLA